MERETASVTWDGRALKIEVAPRGVNHGYSDLDRLCAKLKTRGWDIERTGRGYRRYAVPTNPKFGHPKDKMQIGETIQWPI